MGAFLKGQFVRIAGFLAVALILALGIACLKLSFERRDHQLTQSKLEAAERNLKDAQRALDRLKDDAIINKQVREQLATDLEAADTRLNAIERSAQDRLDALRREMQQRQSCSLPVSGGDDAVPEDYGQRAADILLDGMWEAYRDSVRDPPDRP